MHKELLAVRTRTRTRTPRTCSAVSGLNSSVQGAVKVVDGGKCKDMEEVVTVAYNIESAWIEALRHSQ